MGEGSIDRQAQALRHIDRLKKEKKKKNAGGYIKEVFGCIIFCMISLFEGESKKYEFYVPFWGLHLHKHSE